MAEAYGHQATLGGPEPERPEDAKWIAAAERHALKAKRTPDLEWARDLVYRLADDVLGLVAAVHRLEQERDEAIYERDYAVRGNDALAIRLQEQDAELDSVRQALRELAGRDAGVEAFIGWIPTNETAKEIAAKFARARILLGEAYDDDGSVAALSAVPDQAGENE